MANNYRTGYPSTGSAKGGVYLKRLQYEQPYSVMSNPNSRYIYQDALINSSIQRQDLGARVLRQAASLESTVWSRYGVIYKNFMDLLTGFPEYLK